MIASASTKTRHLQLLPRSLPRHLPRRPPAQTNRQFNCRSRNSSTRSRTTLGLQSGFSLITVAAGTVLIAATVGTFSLLQSLILSGNQDLSPPPVESPEKVAVCEGPQIIRGEWIMAPTAIPEGRAGNLTALQEQKLKELWAALFKLFGTYQASTSPSNPGGPTNGISDPTSASSLNADKRRKSRFNLLGRKKDDSSPAEPNATEPGDFGSGNADDKYGQGEEYKAAVASISPQDIRQYFWAFTKQDDPDALLLRFLRARKWDVQKALAMLVSTINWRTKEYDVDEAIVRVGEMGNVLKAQDPAGSEESRNDGKDFIKQINQGKAFLHGIDREGRPLTYVRARLHKPGAMTARSQEQIVIYCIETCRLTLVPPVDTATIVFDLTDFSIANMDYTMAKFVIKCFEAHYPECLGLCLVHKAPWLFQGVWKIIRGWLDPVVASKVHFTNDVADLQKYIAPECIIRELGGDEDWVYEEAVKRSGAPSTEENARLLDDAAREKIQAERTDLVMQYEVRTMDWVKGAMKPPDRALVAEKLKVNYWKLDPYVRAKSAYDRMGMLIEGGSVDFYPPGYSAPVTGGA